jgi:SPP1 gp7 family putative phage head morphogenesis protein
MAIPADHPHRALFARLEKQAAQDIAAALDRLRRDVVRGIGRDNVMDVFARLQDNDINDRLRQSLYNALLPTADAGYAQAKKELEREVLGVKSIGDPDFDWTMVNQAARDWLKRRTFQLTYANEFSLTRSTERRLRGAIDDFIASPDMTMNQLGEAIGGLFDFGRAEVVAITEVTKAFARSQQAVWKEAGIIEKQRWNTAVDEFVCPICAPLNGRVIGIDEVWGGYIDSPPAHPQCRCWVTPVVEVREETIDEQIIFDMELGTLSEVSLIRPPVGVRAPTGLGQEWADRRAIANKIDTANGYVGKLNRIIDNYRGQKNKRWEWSFAKDHKQEIEKVLEVATEMALSEADWSFKREIIDGLFEFLTEQRKMLRGTAGRLPD